MASSEFADMWKKGIEGFFYVQEDFIHGLNETNRHWLDRIQLEAKLVSEFGSKMAASRSLPEVLTVGQEWASQHFKMMAEDRKHLLEDCQHFTEIGGRRDKGLCRSDGAGSATGHADRGSARSR